VSPAKIIVDVQRDQVPSDYERKQPFQGLWSSLPQRIWSKDSSKIIFSTPSGFTHRIFVVDLIEDQKIYHFPTPKEGQNQFNSYSLLDIFNDKVLVLAENVLTPPQLYCGKVLSWSDDDNAIEWSVLAKSHIDDSLQPQINEYSSHLISLNPEIGPYFSVESLLLLRNSKKSRLIVFPHGGPHVSHISHQRDPIQLYSLLPYIF